MARTQGFYISGAYVAATTIDGALNRLRRGRADYIITMREVSSLDFFDLATYDPSVAVGGNVSDGIHSIPVLQYELADAQLQAIIQVDESNDNEIHIKILAVEDSEIRGVRPEEALSWSTLHSMVKRITNITSQELPRAGFANAIRREVDIANGMQLHSLVSSASVDEIHGQRRDEEEYLVPGSVFKNLMRVRRDVQLAIMRLNSFGLRSSGLGRGLQEAKIDCDSTITSFAGAAMVTMHIRAESESRSVAKFRAANEAHDRKISRIAAILLPPGLWFAFLGANVIPASLFGYELQTGVGSAISVGVAALASILGWLLILRPDSRRKATE